MILKNWFFCVRRSAFSVL